MRRQLNRGDERSAERRRGSHALVGTIRVSALLFGTVGASLARGPVIASLEDFDGPELRRELFTLPASTELEIECVGVADPKGDAFLAQGWILDLESRRPVWIQADEPGEYDNRSENWTTESRVTLPAGSYAAYFSASGGNLPVDEEISILGFKIGKFEMHSGRNFEWDERGESGEWRFEIRAADAGFDPPPPPRAPELFPDAVVRELELRDNAFRQVRIDLDRELEVRLQATGEILRGSRQFADGAWIVDRSTWERVWSLEEGDTEHAGGADKNRVFRGRLILPAGSYIVSVATDGSHAVGSWNAPPPWDPESWGLALTPMHEGDRDAIHALGAALPEPVVSITRMRDDAFERKPFVVERSTQVLIRGLGESSGRGFADFGWIERLSDFERVWAMDEGTRSEPAGGANKNRLVEEAMTLEPGAYALCYVTDDSHAFEDWNSDAPFDPEAWGVSIAELSPSGPSAIRTTLAETETPFVSLAPVGSDEHLTKRFQTTERTQVRVIAIGEGVGGEMTDYGWIERSNGDVVWKMNFKDTSRAGGDNKNREERVVLELPAGTWDLHYVTDDSHAFGDWNATPPIQPHLWGITLIELPD